MLCHSPSGLLECFVRHRRHRRLHGSSASALVVKWADCRSRDEIKVGHDTPQRSRCARVLGYDDAVHSLARHESRDSPKRRLGRAVDQAPMHYIGNSRLGTHCVKGDRCGLGHHLRIATPDRCGIGGDHALDCGELLSREQPDLHRGRDMSQQAAPDRLRVLIDAGIALSSELSLRSCAVAPHPTVPRQVLRRQRPGPRKLR